MDKPQYLSVNALTKYIKRKFDADPHLANIYVKGEISNFKRHTSGHLYFTLKDENARILAVMFARAANTMKFIPENGMNVLIRGNISVYESSGQYQIYVQEMLPDGIGELFLAYEQLKERLDKEGLFRPERKKRLPFYPEKIGIITSPTGAAIRDIMTTIKRRYPIGQMLIFPTLVQGDSAARAIAAAIQEANKRKDIDVLIVGRGGGSIEELWAFNEEAVARAIYNSKVPIISAVGHETDFTIADFVADVRAATPTGAAELAVPHVEELKERLLNRQNRIYRSMAELTKRQKLKLKNLEQSYILRNPRKLYEQKWETIDRFSERMNIQLEKLIFQKTDILQKLQNDLTSHHPRMKLQLNLERHQHVTLKLQKEARLLLKNKAYTLTSQINTLEALSPLNTLKRGFSVAYGEDGDLIKYTKDTKAGEQVKVRVVDGHIHCTVNQIEKGEKDGE